MKLKEILSDIKEKWYSGVESRYGEYIEIFKNPTKEEIEELEDSSQVGIVRFIAVSDNKNVYVNKSEFLHHDMVREIEGVNSVLDSFSGLGFIENNKIVISEFAGEYREGNKKDLKRVLSKLEEGEYDWLEKYNFKLDEIKREMELEEF